VSYFIIHFLKYLSEVISSFPIWNIDNSYFLLREMNTHTHTHTHIYYFCMKLNGKIMDFFTTPNIYIKLKWELINVINITGVLPDGIIINRNIGDCFKLFIVFHSFLVSASVAISETSGIADHAIMPNGINQPGLWDTNERWRAIRRRLC